MRIKRFLEWIGLKEKLDSKEASIPKVSEGQIWWASLGENVGKEINGKSSLFSRPVLIYKKLAKDFYLVIPMSTQIRIGSWYVDFWHRGRHVMVCLHQIRSMDCKRLLSPSGQLDEAEIEKIKTRFKNLYL